MRTGDGVPDPHMGYEQNGIGKARKYYSITYDGRKYLKSKLNEWETTLSFVIIN